MGKPFLLFHWSPMSRRKQILKYGLCPGKLSKCGLWRPPYVCFSKTPSLAWVLSAKFHNEPIMWDLWMIWSNSVRGYETLAMGNGRETTEYRVYHRIFKSDVWYVGSREYKTRGE